MEEFDIFAGQTTVQISLDKYLLCFTANATLLLRLNDELDGIWTSCGLRRRFRRGYGNFGFYEHSDIVAKMVWSQGGRIKRRLL